MKTNRYERSQRAQVVAMEHFPDSAEAAKSAVP
jgi:hypothetical protein